MNYLQKMPSRQSGAGMIEVLVTLVILLVGLLGLAGLQLHAQRSEVESYQRVQALVLLQDMVGRINANRLNAASYVADVGTGDAQPAATDCAALTTIPARDLCEWSNALKGAGEQAAGVAAGAMAGGRGCVAYNAASSVAIVSVAWQGLGDTATPSPGLTCGSGQYGTETKRRVVSVPIRFADLAAP